MVLQSDHPSHATNGPEPTNPTCCMRFAALAWSFRWQRLNIHRLLMIGIQENEKHCDAWTMLIKREICKSKTSQCIWCCSISYIPGKSEYYCVLLHFSTISPFSQNIFCINSSLRMYLKLTVMVFFSWCEALLGTKTWGCQLNINQLEQSSTNPRPEIWIAPNSCI